MAEEDQVEQLTPEQEQVLFAPAPPAIGNLDTLLPPEQEDAPKDVLASMVAPSDPSTMAAPNVPNAEDVASLLAKVRSEFKQTDFATERTMVLDEFKFRPMKELNDEANRYALQMHIQTMDGVYTASAAEGDVSTAVAAAQAHFNAQQQIKMGQIPEDTTARSVVLISSDVPVNFTGMSKQNEVTRDWAALSFIGQRQAELVGQNKLIDFITYLGKAVTTGGLASDTRLIGLAFEEVTGKQLSLSMKQYGTEELAREMQQIFANSSDDQIKTFLQSMSAAIDKHSSWFGGPNVINQLAALDILEKSITGKGVGSQELFDRIQTFSLPYTFGLIGALGKGVTLLTKGGVVKGAATLNKEGAARMVGDTLRTGVPSSTGMDVNQAINYTTSLKSSGTLVEEINRLAPHIGADMEAENKAFLEANRGTSPTTLTEAQRLEEATLASLKQGSSDRLGAEVIGTTQNKIQLEVTRINPATKQMFETADDAAAYIEREGLVGAKVVAQAMDVEKAATLEAKNLPLATHSTTALVDKAKSDLLDWAKPLFKDAETYITSLYKTGKNDDTALYYATILNDLKIATKELSTTGAIKDINVLSENLDMFQMMATSFQKEPTLVESTLFKTEKFMQDGKLSIDVPTNVETFGVPANLVGASLDIMNTTGLKGKFAFLTEETLDGVVKNHPELFSVGQVGKLKQSISTARALAWRPKDVNVVMFAKNFTKLPKEVQAVTLAHELGHHIDFAYLRGADLSARKALYNSYVAWTKSKNRSAYELLREHRHPVENFLLNNGELVAKHGEWFGKSKEQLSKAHGDWYADFQEFYAEQFAKYWTTKNVGVDSLNKYFEGLIEKLKQLYRAVTDQFGISVKPEKDFEKFFTDHIKAIREGKLLPYMKEASFAGGTPLSTEKPALSVMLKENKDIAELALVKKDEGYVIKQQIEEPYMYTGVGTHAAEQLATSGGVLTAGIPKLNITAYTYENAISALHSSAKERNSLTKWFKDGTKGLSGKEQKQVADLLEQIDAASNTGSSLDNLHIGVDYLRANGLNDGQIKMYARVRQIRDWMWAKHNDVMSTELKRNGYTNRVTFKDANLGEVDMAAQPYTNTSTIKSLISTGKIKTLYDMAGQKPTSLSTTDVDKLYAEGKRIVRLRYPQAGYEHLILDDTVILRDLGEVLPYRPHEFSRIYSDKYFVTMKGKQVVDGVESEFNKVFRTAASSREAAQYVEGIKTAIKAIVDSDNGLLGIEELQKTLQTSIGKFGRKPEDFIAAVRNGEIPTDVEYSYRFDRTKEDALTSLVDEHIHNGRMFEGKRGNKLLSVYEDRKNTKSVMDSLGIELSSVSRMASLSEWRTSSIRKWINTFVPEGARTGNLMDDLQRAPIKFEMGSKEYNAAMHERDYIISTLQARSQGEKLMAARARKVMEWMENREGVVGKVSEYAFTGMGMRNAEPLTFLRTMNFSLNLGMFNPSQLLVQAMGMMNAVFVHPVHGAKAAAMAIPLRMALMSDNPEVWNKMAALTAHDGKEFGQVVKAIRTSGIMDSIKSSSLYNNADGFDNIFKEYGGALGKAQSVFFDRGEEFSRLVAWDVARREWMAINVGMDFTNPDAINAITAKMDDFTLGMTKANLANWQRGLLSIPTQFLQYNIKLASELLASATGQSKVFTRKQAASIMFGNLVFWGTAGNGLRGLSDELFGESDLSEEARLALTQGAVSSLIEGLTDAKVAIGSRFGTFNWYSDTYHSIMSGKETIPDLLLGVTKNNLSKMTDVAADLHRLWQGGPLDGEALKEALLSVSTLASGMNNATKVYLLTNNGGRVFNKKGELVANVTEKEAMYQLFGIKAAELDDFYHSQRVLAEDAIEIKDISLLIKAQQHLAHEALLRGDTTTFNRHMNTIRFLYTEDPLKEEQLVKATKEKYKADTGSRLIAEKLAAKNLSVVTTGE